MNWKKTEEFYIREGHKYEKTQEQKDFEAWEKMVMDKNSATGETAYRQRLGDSERYPIVKLVQAKRIRAPDGKEYYKSFKELKGIDTNQNLRTITIQDHEVYIKPEFIRERRRKKDNPNEDELVIVEVRLDQRVYMVPFTPEHVDKELEGQQARRVSFVVAEETEQGSVAPRQVLNVEDFKHKDFDELYVPIQQPTAAKPRR